MNVNAPELLLKLLLNGGRIEHQGYTWAMNEARQLCSTHVVDGGEHTFMIECDISHFCEMAESIGREKLGLCCFLLLGLTEPKSRGQSDSLKKEP